MTEKEIYEKLLNASFRFLSFRPRSEKEIQDFLNKKVSKIFKDSGKHIFPFLKIINRLKELDLVNDEKFARWLIDQRRGSKPRGRRLIELELKNKGIDEAVIEAALAGKVDKEAQPEPDEINLAKKAVAKKAKIFHNLPKNAFRRKLYAVLQRRGFDWETIKSVVDEFCQKL